MRIEAALAAGLLVWMSVARANETTADGKASGAPAGLQQAALTEGWKQEVEIPDLKDDKGNVMLRGAKLKLWAEQGWLLASSETPQGDLEWQIVLAEATAAEAPKVDLKPLGFEIRYGSYWIRENAGNLRVMRQRKTDQSPAWPAAPLNENAKQGAWGGGQNMNMTGWQVGDWHWLTCGPTKQRHDICVRVQHKDLLSGGTGVTVMPGLYHFVFGDFRFQDEGDLFVGQRLVADENQIKEVLLSKKIRKELKGSAAPALDTQKWLNLDADSSLEQLRGKVVLLDFWGTWCGACVEKLPHSEALHQKFKDRGLVVIGVHSEQGSDEAAAFVKEKGFTFPVALDRGDSAKRYAVEAWPTYFLIDKNGKVKWGFSNSPPSEKQIEELLGSGG